MHANSGSGWPIADEPAGAEVVHPDAHRHVERAHAQQRGSHRARRAGLDEGLGGLANPAEEAIEIIGRLAPCALRRWAHGEINHFA